MKAIKKEVVLCLRRRKEKSRETRLYSETSSTSSTYDTQVLPHREAEQEIQGL